MMIRHALLAASLLSLVVPDIAQAQRDGPGQGRPEGGQRPGGGARPQRPETRPFPGRPGGPQIQPTRPGRPDRPGRPGGGGPGGPQIQPPRPGRPVRPEPPRPGRPDRPRPPHRPGVGRPPNFRPIHRPGFQYPRGYRYRRWTIGLLLPSLFLSSTYYFDDYAALGVGPPPPGYRWVRYGPDLLLVSVHGRRIADVIYGAFN